MVETDDRLQQAVIDELQSEDDLRTSTIGVAVKDGLVELSGHVHNLPDKHAAERAVKRVAGVRGIRDKLKVLSE